MDRSYLSAAAVVAASRKFVCIRLATYESAAEAKFLKPLFRTRSGELENTVFTILSPDGKKKLVRAGRSPRMTFRGPEDESVKEMAVTMERLAGQYPGTASPNTLPYLADLRRGLNVASCDIMPLVVIAAGSEAARKNIEGAVLKLAWDKEFIGAFAYAWVSDLAELKTIAGAARNDGVLIVAPDAYGVKGTLLAQAAGTDPAGLRKALAQGLAKYKPKSKDSRHHIREGRQSGVHWKTEIEVTDPGGPGRRR